MSRRQELWLFGTLVALALAIRVYRLDAESVWLDEAATFLRSTRTVPDVFRNSVERMHNPSYFLLMHYWLQFGDDEFMLRLPSVVFGTLAVGAAYVLGRIVGGVPVGAVTAILVMLAPQQVRYAQEARMYATYVMAATIALAGLLWLVQHLDQAAAWPRSRARAHLWDGAGRAWCAFAVGTLLTLYTHNTAALFVVSCWLAAMVAWWGAGVHRRGWWWRWFLANVVVFLLWTPWVHYLFTQVRRIREEFWAKFPTTDTIVGELGELYLMTSDDVLLASVLACAALAGAWSLRKRPVVAANLVLLALMPPVMILAISLRRPIFLPRIMLWSTVPFFVLIAYGLCASRHAIVRVLAAGAVVVLCARNLQTSYYAVQQKPDWRGALAHLVAEQTPDSIVLLIGGREIRPIRYYLRRKIDPIPPFEMKWTEPPRLDRHLARKKWAWLISVVNSPNAQEIRSLMRTRGRQVWQGKYGKGLRVTKYRLKATKARSG